MARLFHAFLFHTVFHASHALADESNCATTEPKGEASQVRVLMQKKTWAGKHRVVVHEKEEPLRTDEDILPDVGNENATRRMMTDVAIGSYEDSNGMIRSSQGPGAYETLDDAGFQVVAATCCNYQMEEFVRRLVIDLGMELCGEGGLNGLVPFYTCTGGAKDYDTMRADIIKQASSACGVAATPGNCAADLSKCPGSEDVTAHRRRTCRDATSTTLVPTTTTTAVQTTTTTTSTGCKGETNVLDFFNSQLQQSNLGGHGPDDGATNMRFQGVGSIDGQAYDLVVAATSSYTPGNISKNGYECGQASADCINGRFVGINVEAGTSVDLFFSFQDSATQVPVTIPSFLFSVHDIDQLSSSAQELVYMSGYENDVIVDADAEFSKDVQDDGRLRLSSTHDGTSCDNPLNPLQLGTVTCSGVDIDAMKRSAAFVFKDKSSISLSLEVTCDACPAGTSRTFLLTGDTNLVSCAGLKEY